LTDFSKIYILAEDARQQLFVRRYLYRAGYERHAIDPEVLPKGTGGAGEQWVRQRYSAAVAKYRKRAARAKTALIVILDADTETVSRRARQLSEALGNDARKEGETIIHFIPKRNIETWILHLNGEEVDEEKDHRNRDVDDLIPAAAAAFHAWTPQPPERCLPSLRAGIEETKRLA
jgi:hypothetical protein